MSMSNHYLAVLILILMRKLVFQTWAGIIEEVTPVGLRVDASRGGRGVDGGGGEDGGGEFGERFALKRGRRRWRWRWSKVVVPRGGTAAWWGKGGIDRARSWLRTRWRPVTSGRDVVVKAIAAFLGAPPARRPRRPRRPPFRSQGLPLAQPRYSPLSTRERRKVSLLCSGMCGSGGLASSAGKAAETYLPRAR
jgi:hypothetical protein